MKLPALALLALALPTVADNFVERWPQPLAVDPAPVTDPVQRPLVRRARAERQTFVCHRQTYYRGRHRFWRCMR
jgi:hypothetical protein